MKEKTSQNYLLAMLVLMTAISYFDRFIFALVLEPIKQDLLLSDSQLGLMTGIAFAVFYAVAGVPIARWADRGDRITISALSVGLLGIMVSLCGMAANFIQLLLARAGVAVGEAGAIPAAQSLITDHFSKDERPRAMAIYFMAYPISMIFGYLLGGWLVDSYGWRMTFVMVGIPGLIVAIAAKLTLKDPRQLACAPQSRAVLPSLKKTFVTLWRQKTFRQIFYAFCVSYFFLMGVSQWQAAFFMRSHGMSASEVGTWFALVWGVFGMLGNYLGGFYCNRFAAGDEPHHLRLVGGLFVINSIVSVAAYMAENKYLALAMIAITAVLSSFGNGPIFSAIQSIVTSRMRSISIAILFLFANLIGFGLGPLSLGVISDLLMPSFDTQSLRYALVIFSPGGALIAYFYWKAARTIHQDMLYTSRQSGLENDGKNDGKNDGIRHKLESCYSSREV